MSSSLVKPIRILRIIARLNIGGPARHVILLEQGLVTYDRLLVTGLESASEGNMKDLLEQYQIPIKIIPELGREINLGNDFKTLAKLYRLIAQYRPHIVHTHTAKAGLVGRIAAKLAGVPIIVHTFHGHVFHGYFSPAKTKLFILLEKFCAHLSDRLITISPKLKTEIANYGIAPLPKIAVIPLGFDLKPFVSQTRYQGTFRQSLNLPHNIKLIAAVGRLVKIKNLHLFLDAAALIHQQLPDLYFALIGDGELRSELENYSHNLGIFHRVIFTGWRQDLPEIYADLDAVIISSDNEGTPASLIEAMATGCPVIATNVGGVPDLVTEERGRTVPPQNPKALASAILDLVHNPEKTNSLAQTAQAYTLETYHADRLIADLDLMYQTLLTEKGLTT